MWTLAYAFDRYKEKVVGVCLKMRTLVMIHGVGCRNKRSKGLDGYFQ
jgi:hypothetical protein